MPSASVVYETEAGVEVGLARVDATRVLVTCPVDMAVLVNGVQVFP